MRKSGCDRVATLAARSQARLAQRRQRERTETDKAGAGMRRMPSSATSAPCVAL